MSAPPVLATLAKFQLNACEALAGLILTVANYIRHAPEHRDAIARSAGVMLLEGPIGSGKTLTSAVPLKLSDAGCLKSASGSGLPAQVWTNTSRSRSWRTSRSVATCLRRTLLCKRVAGLSHESGKGPDGDVVTRHGPHLFNGLARRPRRSLPRVFLRLIARLYLKILTDRLGSNLQRARSDRPAELSNCFLASTSDIDRDCPRARRHEPFLEIP